MEGIYALIMLGILIGVPITILIVRDRIRRKRHPSTADSPATTTAAPLGWRILRGGGILFYVLVMDMLLTGIGQFFFPNVFSPIRSLVQMTISLALVIGTLIFLRLASQKITTASAQPEHSYDGGLIVILLAGIAAWAWLVDTSLLWVGSLSCLVTLIGGLYVLFKVKVFLWKNYLMAGLGIGLSLASLGLPAAARAAKSAEEIRAQKLTPIESKPSSELLPVQQNGKWGYINRTGQMIITAQFDGVVLMDSHVAGVETELASQSAGAGDVRLSIGDKEYTISRRFHFARPFSSGLAVVKIGGKFGFINATGKLVIEPKFDLVSPFSEGLAVVQFGEKIAFIDSTGKTAIQPQLAFGEAMSFSEGMAAISLDKPDMLGVGRWGYIDRTGKVVIQPQFLHASRFAQGLAKVAVEALGKEGYIDKRGAVAIPPQFADAHDFSDGLAAVEIDGKWGFIDKNGKQIIAPQFSEAWDFSDGLARVRFGDAIADFRSSKENLRESLSKLQSDEITGKWAYVDKTGKVVIKPQFDQAWYFAEGLAPVRIEQKWGYIDKTGTIVIPPQFDRAYCFMDGCAPVEVGNKIGYIDLVGKWIWKPSD